MGAHIRKTPTPPAALSLRSTVSRGNAKPAGCAKRPSHTQVHQNSEFGFNWQHGNKVETRLLTGEPMVTENLPPVLLWRCHRYRDLRWKKMVSKGRKFSVPLPHLSTCPTYIISLAIRTYGNCGLIGTCTRHVIH